MIGGAGEFEESESPLDEPGACASAKPPHSRKITATPSIRLNRDERFSRGVRFFTAKSFTGQEMDIGKVKYIDSEYWVVDANLLRPDGFDQMAGFVYPPCNIP